jgi:glyoxylase-like metal-dependent hydrolase (beta-lactamase superfamily II)
MRNKIIATCISLCFIHFVAHGQDENFDIVQIKTTKITETIYMLEGSGGNIGVLAGKDGIILIDDQFGPLTEKIKKALAQISDQPVKFVINTHFHADHTGGNENFGGQGAIIVSHENNRKRLSTDQFLAAFEAEMKASPYDALPKVTFTDSVTFHMNGETVNVVYVKNAHTDGDVIIHFKESNVFHCGDVFVRYGFPFIDQPNGGSIDGMIKGTDLLISRTNEQSKIIPGHGALAVKKDLIDYKKMLVTVRKKVADGIKQGKTLEQVVDTDPTKGYITVMDKTAFIKTVYDSLKK